MGARLATKGPQSTTGSDVAVGRANGASRDGDEGAANITDTALNPKAEIIFSIRPGPLQEMVYRLHGVRLPRIQQRPR